MQLRMGPAVVIFEAVGAADAGVDANGGGLDGFESRFGSLRTLERGRARATERGFESQAVSRTNGMETYSEGRSTS